MHFYFAPECLSTVSLTNVSEDGGHCICASLVAGQTAIYSSILLLRISYNQCTMGSHPVSEHATHISKLESEYPDIKHKTAQSISFLVAMVTKQPKTVELI